MSARFFSEDGKELVEITNEADKNSVILPADSAQQARYPQEWAKFKNLGARTPHHASTQTTPLPTEPVKADNPANDPILDRDDENDGKPRKASDKDGKRK